MTQEQMTIEQKAKRYDEALKVAKDIRNGKATYIQDGTPVIEALFPELAVSDDEKIRKAIIEFFESQDDNTTYSLVPKKDILTWLEKQGERELVNFDEAEKEKSDFVGDGFIECHADFLDFKEGNTYWLEYMGDDKYNVRSDNLLGKTYHITPCQLYTVFKKLTWLEKQGGQKPTDKAEPKFHKGEWITNGDYTWKIIEIRPLVDYTLQSQDGSILDDTISHVDEQFHSFTIEDAKDGDVLATEPIVEGYYSPFVAIYKEQNEEDFDSYCFIGFDGKFYKGENGHSTEEVHPATKEQRNLLFQKMKEAGYEWDVEKKELKKIEPYSLRSIIKDEPSHAIKKVVDSLSAWSEEDERMYRGLHNLIYSTPYCDSRKELSDWLKSFKDRVQSQPQQEWGEEDEKRVDQICEDLKCGLINFNAGKNVKGLHFDKIIESNIDWLKNRLKSLKSQKEEQTEWDGTEIAPPIDSDVCG